MHVIRRICLYAAALAVATFTCGAAVLVPVSGQLTQVSVGFDGTTWGVNGSGEIYRWDANASTWDWIPGALTQIAVASSSVVWGLNARTKSTVGMRRQMRGSGFPEHLFVSGWGAMATLGV